MLVIQQGQIQWGTPARGLCRSTTILEEVSWGHSTIPDALITPVPSGDGFVVTRLRLLPSTCNNTVAVIQLAQPLSNSSMVDVNTYSSAGVLISSYGSFQRLTP